jgi:hypothetical protein
MVELVKPYSRAPRYQHYCRIELWAEILKEGGQQKNS